MRGAPKHQTVWELRMSNRNFYNRYVPNVCTKTLTIKHTTSQHTQANTNSSNRHWHKWKGDAEEELKQLVR
eukprot:gene13084-3830_t